MDAIESILHAVALERDRLPALLAELAAVDSGLSLVYRCLDTLVRDLALHDALVVVEEPLVGRQAFLAGRRAPDSAWSHWHSTHARPGLYTDPVVVDAEPEVATMANLCVLAFRLTLARYDSLHDALTGLYNRRCFEELLGQAVDRSRRLRWSFALALVDLDNFKQLNDRLGHAAGDQVLEAVGSEMRRALRKGDVAARLGGDEFALILPCADPTLVPTILEKLAAGVALDGASPVGFSVGVAHCPDDAGDADGLYRIADERLYEHKSR